MPVRVLVGDAKRALVDLVRPGSIDCIIADPPYGSTSLAWDRRIAGWARLCLPLLRPAGSMWVFASMRMILALEKELDGWHFVQDIVWEKHNGTSLFNDRFRRVHEHALHLHPAKRPWSHIYRDPQHTMDATKRSVRQKARPAHWLGAHGPSTYRSEDGGPRLVRSVIYGRSEHHRALHPTQKPLPLVETLLRYSCPPGGLVLDPFAGSGTVGVAAARNGRHAILIESKPAFAAIARQRLALEDT